MEPPLAGTLSLCAMLAASRRTGSRAVGMPTLATLTTLLALALPAAAQSGPDTAMAPVSPSELSPSGPRPETPPNPSSARSHNRARAPRRRKKPESEREWRPEQGGVVGSHSCLMRDACLRGAEVGTCYRPHPPRAYRRDEPGTEDFYEMLLDNCPHFFDAHENLLHPLCCSPEQEESISRLNANVDLIRRSCPSCVVNVRRLFCNLFCAPNQRDFLSVQRVKGDAVVEVTYAVSSHFADYFFASCRDVRVFGAYLLDYEYGCGRHKRANCTTAHFLSMLGSLRQLPLNFRPLIVPRHAHNQSAHWPLSPMNDTAYDCDQAPPAHSACRCEHCEKACTAHHHNPHSPAHTPTAFPGLPSHSPRPLPGLWWPLGLLLLRIGLDWQ